MSFRISKAALKDLEIIWVYSFEIWSQQQADRYIQLIFEEIKYLCANPFSGRDRSDIKAQYRSSKVRSHLIFYIVEEKSKKIHVVRILHQNMDLQSQFLK